MLPDHSLVTLLALVGSRRMGIEELRRKTRLDRPGFEKLLGLLQREYLVDVVSALKGGRVEEEALLTERGEAILVRLLEVTCELPELN